MESITLILGVTFLFGLAISYAIKIDLHFDYNKITNSEKLNKYRTVMEANTKLGSNPKLALIVFLPLFLDRRFDIESSNPKLRLLGNKIIKSIVSIWIIAALDLALFLFRYFYL